MTSGSTLLCSLVSLCGLSSIAAQFLTCGFQDSCEGFITSIDNQYNVDTDVPWTRVSRLQTSSYKSKTGNTFLAIYKPAAETEASPPAEDGADGGHEMTSPLVTSRLVIPAPPQQVEMGCLRLRFRLENGTMELRDLDSDDVRMRTTSNGTGLLTDGIQQSYSALTPQTNRTLLVATLWEDQRAEFGLDSVHMYQRNCSEVSDDDDGDDPLWPPTTTTTAAPPTAPAGGIQNTTPRDSAPSNSAGWLGIVTCFVLFYAGL